ncbi:DUF1772 domain-containing protein [Micromonospora yasonensis]|uniref:DUF1772 domain-containing protein n=1 Tax=Micromonospora yasonensis TaxID=1128667 RepID=UPI00222ECD22|nr:DUF1772 domain-containing protein [Micromonospora yasonensis]MCW3840378.1 DUF1772 domain-containing protein [Micromonospora yasonensis]
MTQFLLPIVLVSNGMAAGGLMIAVLGGAPLMFVLPVGQYITVEQFLTTRFDPFMPICLVTTILLDGSLAFVAPDAPSRRLFALASLLTACAITVSITRNFPINRWVRTLDPERIPENWDEVDPRKRWRNWNFVRATLTILALLVNVTAVSVLV